MATTRYKVEIRLFNKPIYFRSKFIGGRMERKVLVLSDALHHCHLCISIRDMKKLPTLRWCNTVSSEYSTEACRKDRFVFIEDDRMKESKTVWNGEISEKKYNLLRREYY